MADVAFLAVIVAFFALTVVYVKGCERIVGPETDVGVGADAEAETKADEAKALESMLRGGR